MLGNTLLDGIQREFNKAIDTTQNLIQNDSKALYTTVEGQPWNSDALHTDAQKRFLTKSPIPNYPKVGNLTYVYFSINPKVAQMIQKKHNKIKGWSNLLKNYYEHRPTMESISFQTDLNVGQPTNVQQSASGSNKKESAVDSAIKNVVGTATAMVKDAGNAIIDGAKAVLNAPQKIVNDSIVTPIKNYFKTEVKSLKTSVKSFFGLNEETKQSLAEALDYVETPDELRKLSIELSKFVKSVDRPKIKLNTYTLNQYNRKRITYKNVEFPAIKVSFHDVKNSPVQRFFFSYLKCINDTFLLKNKNSYTADNLLEDYDTYYEEWGFNTDSNFMLIDRITVIEWLADKMTAYNYNNPKISNIDMSSSTLGDWNPQEVSVTFEYEGLTTDMFDIPELNDISGNQNLSGYQKYFIGKDIVKEVATLVNMNYKGSTSNLTDMATAFIQGVLNNKNSSDWQTIKQQAIETARKLGYAEEIDYYNQFESDLKNYKDGGAKVIYNTLYSPASAVGILVNEESNQFASYPINT